MKMKSALQIEKRIDVHMRYLNRYTRSPNELSKFNDMIMTSVHMVLLFAMAKILTQYNRPLLLSVQKLPFLIRTDMKR